MPVTDWINAAESWLQTHVHSAVDFALFGVVIAGIIALVAVLALLRWVGLLVAKMKNSARARKLRTDPSPGYRVLLANPSGGGGAGKWLMASLEEHLADFSFGAPFRLARSSALKGGLQPQTVRRARRRMKAADADLVIWGMRTDKGPAGLVLHGLSRGGGLTPADARLFTLTLPGNVRRAGGKLPQLAAYLIAKRMQPALANPQSFRPEKMQQVSALLEAMLADMPGVTSALRHEIEADFCGSAVHVASQMGDLPGLDCVISMRRQHLADMATDADPVQVMQARMDLGRALLARTEKVFDAGQIEEAIQNLSKVIEALQADPVIQRAQLASDSLFRAQTLVESRKRFSVNFGT